MTRSAARLLVDCLAEQGCDRVFTVPGESFLAVLDALLDRPEIHVVSCRHESGAAFMACADGALNAAETGRPGIAFVTRGPGAANASIGVHVAFQDSQPMILFVGDVARDARGREGFQEVDLPAIFTPLAKWAARIDDARRIPEYVARAFATAISGRPGPVVLALPEDMLRETVEAAPRPFVQRPAQAPRPEALAAIMALLRGAAAPVAIVGGAGWGAPARQHFARFAERLGLPVATAFRRQDALDPGSPVYAGNLGYGPSPKLVERIRSADLILAVGARLGEATTEGYTLPTPDHPGQTLVHVHSDPGELNRVYRADLAICAGPDEFAESAARWDHGPVVPSGAGGEAHREWLEWSDPRGGGRFALDLAECLVIARRLLPADTIVCNGAGNFSGWWHRYWRYHGFPSQLAPTAGAMGYGLPAAVAAALRYPERTVLAVAGDGDFLMSVQELATAAQQGCNLIVIVIDNGSYGTIRMHQELSFPGRVSATNLTNPDFAALARAFGGCGERAETTAQFAQALAKAASGRSVRLLHCLTDIEQLSAAGVTVSGLRAR
ncbi:MAG: thiamine pyrophosphate-binding protein [Croceibacterium sp.]